MPKLFRTLGPVAPPVNPEDIANKGYVDNIPAQNLAYLRLSEKQIVPAGNPAIYAASADVGMGDILSGALTIYSRAPFPLKIIRMGMSLQSQLGTNYNLGLTAPYVMSITKYNNPTSTPPFVVLGSATMPVGTRQLDTDQDINLGIGAQDVYDWSFATTGTSTNISSINLIAWFEFREITTEQYDAEQETQQQRIQELNEQLKDQEWYQNKMQQHMQDQQKANKPTKSKSNK